LAGMQRRARRADVARDGAPKRSSGCTGRTRCSMVRESEISRCGPGCTTRAMGVQGELGGSHLLAIQRRTVGQTRGAGPGGVVFGAPKTHLAILRPRLYDKRRPGFKIGARMCTVVCLRAPPVRSGSTTARGSPAVHRGSFSGPPPSNGRRAAGTAPGRPGAGRGGGKTTASSPSPPSRTCAPRPA